MKKYRTIFTAFLLCFFIIPQTFHAEEYDELIDEASELERVIEQDAEKEDQAQLDLQYEQDAELFPEEEGMIIEQQRIQEISDTHVFTRVNGVPVILQDVPLTEWFAYYVRDIADRGIISGYKDASGLPLGLFGPADEVTIEQLAKIAVESAEVDQTKCPENPINVSAQNSWSAVYMACAEHLSWAIYEEGVVDPARPATRTEVIVTALEAFGRTFEIATGDVFEDVSNTLTFRNAIETAALDGIVTGYTDPSGNPTGFFGPFDNVNRAEMAKIFSLAIQTYSVF